MKAIRFNNKGNSLVEVIISVAILAVLFGTFAMIMTGAYKSHLKVANRKETRETADSNLEGVLGKGTGTVAVGSLNVTLENVPDINKADGALTNKKFECKINSASYQDTSKKDTTPENKYNLYTFSEASEVTT
jgi:hypothetical protein